MSRAHAKQTSFRANERERTVFPAIINFAVLGESCEPSRDELDTLWLQSLPQFSPLWKWQNRSRFTLGCSLTIRLLSPSERKKNKHASVSRFLYIRHSRNDVHVDVIQTYRRRPRVRCRRQRIYFYVSLARVNSPRWTPRGNPPGRVRRVHLWRWIPPGYTGSWHDERIIYARGIRNKIQYVQCCISSVIYLANCQCIISLFTFIFVCGSFRIFLSK